MTRFKNILCLVEKGEENSPALQRAVALAESNQAQLTAAMIAPATLRPSEDLPDGWPGAVKLRAAIVESRLSELKSLTRPYGERLKIDTVVLEGTLFLETIRAVLRNSFDLVIKSPDSLDFVHRLLGSDDMHLLRKCPCPVWIIKPEVSKNYKCILAAVDVDDSYPPGEMEARRHLNVQILELASAIAVADSADLHIAHAWEAFAESSMRSGFLRVEKEVVEEYVEQVRKSHANGLASLLRDMTKVHTNEAIDFLKPQEHLVKGWPRKVIPELARELNADLVVMGTVARTGVPGFIMGNTAETILGQLDCSVLAVKPPGFVSPVTLNG